MSKLLREQGLEEIRETNHGTLFEYPGKEEWATVIVPRHRNLKTWVGKDALKVLERLLAEEEEGD